MAKLGVTILRHDCVTSTNDLARDLAAAGAPEGVVVTAREQTAGRGRQGRTWESGPDEGLYLSVILRPRMRAIDAPILTLGAAVAVAETLKYDFSLTPDIKWPNDLMVGGKKICGILAESATEAGDHIQYFVLGIGVNIRQQEFPDAIAGAATSLRLECGDLVSPEGFLEPLLGRLEHWYRQTMNSPVTAITRWEQLSTYARDCQVRVLTPEGCCHAVTRGLAPGGALVIELDSGEIREIRSGEVSLRSAI